MRLLVGKQMSEAHVSLATRLALHLHVAPVTGIIIVQEQPMLFEIVLAFEGLATWFALVELTHGHHVRRKRLRWGRKSALKVGVCIMLLQFHGLEGSELSTLLGN